MPQIPPVSREQNMFTPEQAQMLGDIVMQEAMKDFTFVRAPGVTEYLQQIVDRMAEIAGTGRVKVALIDYPYVNAFTLPGANVLVARKLVSFARSEDELAGVLAHELGHVVKRDAERDISAMLRSVLKVTSIGDRADIELKYNQLLENERRGDRRSLDKVTDKEQQVADQVALWLMARAGYKPQAYADVFDRMAELKSDTGGWLSDFWGTTKPESKRLRAALRALESSPTACVAARQSNDAQFSEWQQRAVEASRGGRSSALHDVLNEKKLDPPLRSDLSTLRFSPDGQLVLAQDDASIFIFTRDKLAFVFRIDASNAAPAMFTPDSDAVVFYDENYRVERWDVAAKRREWVHELALTTPCAETELSPDGSLMACVTGDFDLRLIEVATGNVAFEKKNFYAPELYDLFAMFAFFNGTADRGSGSFFQLRFTLDGRYFVGARGTNYVALDLTTRKPISLPGAIRDRIGVSFTFMGNDRIVGLYKDRIDESAIVTFPKGEVVTKLKLGMHGVAAATHGDRYVLIRGLPGYPISVFGVKENKPLLGTKLPGLDVYDDTMLAERKNGELALYRLGTSEVTAAADVPVGPLGRLRAAGISPDLSTLAVSETSRGGVWSAIDGQRKMLVRGFRGVHVDGAQQTFADFPKEGKSQRAVVQLDAATHASVALIGIEPPVQAPGPGDKKGNAAEPGDLNVQTTITSRNLSQYGRFLAGWADGEKENAKPAFVVYDVANGRQVWTRELPKGRPQSFKAEARHDTLTFSWSVDSDGGKAMLDTDRPLKRQFDQLHAKKDEVELIEIVDLATGNTRGRLLIDSANANLRVTSPISVRDCLMFTDDHNRTLAYSLATGKQTGHAFGSPIDVTDDGHVVAVQNDKGEVSLFSLPAMEKVDDLMFPSEVVFGRFNKDGTEFFVLTAEQTAYRLKVPAGRKDITQ